MKVTVVGAGVIGAAVAWQLARNGMEVVSVADDRAGTATEAALGYISAPSGVEVPADVVELAAQAYWGYERFLRDLLADSGTELPIGRSGYLHVTTDPEDVRIALMAESWRAAGLRCESLRANALREAEPMLGPGVVEGIILHDSMSVAPVQLRAALIRGMTHRGGTSRSGTVAGLEPRHGPHNACAVLANGERLTSDVIVLATGAWGRELGKTENLEILQPVRGTAIELQSLSHYDLVRPVSTSDGLDALPRGNGRIVVGSSNEHAGLVEGTPAGIANEVLARLFEVLPQTRDFLVTTIRSGFRPCTSTKRPTVEVDVRFQNVLVVSGHCQDGVLLAPVVADQVLQLLKNGSSN